MTLERQLLVLFVLAIPIASIAWTVTHEEVFREPRDWCAAKSKSCRSIYARKFFYLFTCEYCFSHYVTAFFLIITRYKLLFDDWRGYLVAGFSLVWMANVYMSFFARLRLEIRENRMEVAAMEGAEVTSAQEAGGSPDAARTMRDSGHGCAPVVEDAENLRRVGVVIEGDVCCVVAGDDKLASEVRVEEIMPPSSACCGADEPENEACKKLHEHRVTSLPVVDKAGDCCGTVSARGLEAS